MSQYNDAKTSPKASQKMDLPPIALLKNACLCLKRKLTAAPAAAAPPAAYVRYHIYIYIYNSFPRIPIQVAVRVPTEEAPTSGK